MFKNSNLFTIITKFLIAILPFYVIIKVFFEVKIWLPYFGFFIKEWLIIILLWLLIFEFIRKKIKPNFDILDYLIFAYFTYWIGISLFNGISITWIIYWWRYDFIFLVVFLIFRHSKIILKSSLNDLIKIFLIFGWISLFISIIIKFIIWEEVLEIFWFSMYVDNWYYKWGIPMYHWVEASWLRRFQWILDSPNAMAFYLITYAWLFLHIFRKKIDFFVIFTSCILLWLVISTYSRSALLWIFNAWLLLFIINISIILKKYKKQTLIWIIAILIFSAWFYFSFERKINNILIRSWSTNWHFERMDIWLNRFYEKPFWQWLATSWPWFRSIYEWTVTKEDEKYYIPESWFIQQLVEWWFIYFSLFISIFTIIILNSYKKSKAIFALLIAIMTINMLLHIFEATYLSILLFIFIGFLLNKKYEKIV